MQPSTDQIEQYLSRVREAGAMGKSERRLRLLEHLLKSEAAGNGEGLKAYSIGLDVFQKPQDFDPSTDSIVRVEIGRVRTGILTFEASDFADTEIVVEIPVGTYQPQISLREMDLDRDTSEPSVAKVAPKKLSWLRPPAIAAGLITITAMFVGFGYFGPSEPAPLTSIQVQQFSGDQEYAANVSQSLRRELSKNMAFRVLATSVPGVVDPDADFLLRGRVSDNGSGHRISAELVSIQTNSIVWAHSAELHAHQDIGSGENVAFSNELRVQLFSAIKDLLEDRDPEGLTPAELFVRATWVPGSALNAEEWELERIALTELALEKDADFGAAHSVMADKLSYLANVYPPFSTPETLEKARLHAQRAMELAPRDPDAVFNVAQSRWHRGALEESIATMNRVVELDGSHDLARFLSSVIPYTCALPPDEVLGNAIAFDARLSADNPIRWLTLTWIAWLHTNRQSYQAALKAEEQAALVFQIPYTFMRHAMLLNKLGRVEEAENIIRSQMVNWPDVDAEHFATVTYPTFCDGQPLADQVVGDYSELAAAMRGRF